MAEVRSEVVDGVGVVTLDAPARRNAFVLDMCASVTPPMYNPASLCRSVPFFQTHTRSRYASTMIVTPALHVAIADATFESVG